MEEPRDNDPPAVTLGALFARARAAAVPPPPALAGAADLVQRIPAPAVQAPPEDAPPPVIAPLDDALDEARRAERLSRKRRRDVEDDEAEEEAQRRERARVLRHLRLGRQPYRIKCFLCAYGDTQGFDATSEAGDRAYAKLVDLIKADLNSNNRVELAKRACNFYLAQLWLPSVDTEWELPLQTPDDFLEHLERHTLNPVLKVGSLMTGVFDALDYTRLTFQQDKRAIDKFVKLGTLAARLLTIPRQGTFFGAHMDPLGDLDPAALGEVANLRALRGLTHQGRRTNTIGGATAADTEATEAARATRRAFGGQGGGEEAPV